MDWPITVEEKVKKFAEKKGLKGKKLEKFMEKAYETYKQNLIAVYESVGFLAAHSMGEPATQLILRTKHYAGAAEVSIGSGIERLEALVDARSKTKYPIMTIFLKKDVKKTDKDLDNYLKQIIFKRLDDICEIKEDLNNKKITIELDPKILKDLNLSQEIIKEKVKAIIKVKPNESKNKLEYDFNEVSLITIRKYFLKMKEIKISGIEGIKDAIIAEEDNEKVIKTQGTNLKEVFKLDFVDANRTYTNDIFETYKVLGIEAARNLLYKEIYSVYDTAGIGIDKRHVLLLADTMCYDGTVRGVVRTGIVSTKSSPLARAAFEQTEKVLFDAAFNEEVEKFHGVVENVMAGLPINVGVGNVDLVMEFNSENAKKTKKK